ncbi:hypothetical protein [Romboutsia sp.]|uniref:hypothetical protein n=1 Tax=Romboutsia sp. TaxID=1965302 RepID=UPI002CB78AA0|nr:hypothetical protein [Romboutsia sp.]HSQ89368.1 hypothetical protein [Romboutsia sp.]
MKNLTKLTKVAKYVKENNIEIFNASDVITESYHGATIVVLKNDFKIAFMDACDKNKKQMLCVLWTTENKKPSEEGYICETKKFKSQKAMIEFYEELTADVAVEKQVGTSVKEMIKVCDTILKRNFKGNIYAQWAGDMEGNEYVCVVFNDRLSIYINVEEVDGKYKITGDSGDEIAGGSWYDLEEEEVKKYSKQIEEILNM